MGGPSWRLELNCDGAYNIDNGCGGVCMIIRRVGGTVVAAWSKHFSHLSSALHSEAEACRSSLQIAIDQGWRNIEMESDSVTIVTALNNREFLPSEAKSCLLSAASHGSGSFPMAQSRTIGTCSVTLSS
ncbi:hypothetical protein ACLB2K_046433 [Fragaria x ananassa]